ncbi:helix-turn-helix transcriptional regulator [Roseateles sp.]|uniref:helix-turn-helix domain-containing protein n=1 Tax=Roseateles sp. TaxID=1971397 RepID=UPI002E18E485
MDIIRLPSDLGAAVRSHRQQLALTAVDVAARAGRSRDILYRLERGEDVTVSALLDILRALGLSLALQPAGMPTLAEMQRRFGAEALDDDDAA